MVEFKAATFTEYLDINLIPESAYGSNLRKFLKPKEWDIVRKKVYAEAEYLCKICGGQGNRHPVEAHEDWEFDDKNHIMTLRKVVALCPSCHRANHLGFTQNVLGDEAFQFTLSHISKINGWSMKETEMYVDEVAKKWHERSSHSWELNIDKLRDYLPDFDISRLQK